MSTGLFLFGVPLASSFDRFPSYLLYATDHFPCYYVCRFHILFCHFIFTSPRIFLKGRVWCFIYFLYIVLHLLSYVFSCVLLLSEIAFNNPFLSFKYIFILNILFFSVEAQVKDVCPLCGVHSRPVQYKECQPTLGCV